MKQKNKSVPFFIWPLLASISLLALAATVLGAENPAAATTYTNRLADSNNPYLLLHADNPVDWYPWGPEAIEKARSENKPIFLSVGYSTCYWCHVAERTLYSNPEIAKLMNQWFISVKVDREQRPDIDRVYIVAQQLIAGTSGWPNNVFLTPDLKPFFAGSYFPPEMDPFGRLGFSEVLENMHRAWEENRSDILAYAETVHTSMQQLQTIQAVGAELASGTPTKWLKRARQSALHRFDRDHGGFANVGNATKFPETPTLQLLLADYVLHRNEEVLRVLTATLDAMAYGAIRDQIGGGFHRYSINSTWSVPHFEKMLYDNAQLLRLYAEAFKATGAPLYRFMAEDVGRYLIEQMMAPQGGFYTARDAQIDGVEGASYLWRRSEIEKILGPESANRFFDVYELTPSFSTSGVETSDLLLEDPFESGVLRVRLPIEATLERVAADNPVTLLESLSGFRERLLVVRDSRPQPMRDEKLNVDLNGLAIEAFIIAGRTLQNSAYIEHARRAAERIWALAYDPSKRRLMHQIYQGHVDIDGFVSDYALFGRALLSLHDATGNPVWRKRAIALAEIIAERFLDVDGTLRMTADRTELPLAAMDTDDDAYPSGISATIDLWLRLAATDEAARFAKPVMSLLRRSAPRIALRPGGWAATVLAVNTAKSRALITSFSAAEQTRLASLSGEKRLTEGLSFSSADHVRIASATQESSTSFTVKLDIDDGYHVNANPASHDYLIPTSLSFEATAPVRIAYPDSTMFKPAFSDTAIAVYSENPVIEATFPASSLEDLETLQGKVTVQACNDELCLLPSDLPVSISLSK